MEAAEKWCVLCNKTHPIEEFGVDRSKKDSRNKACKKSRNDQCQARRAVLTPETRDWRRKVHREWLERQRPRRACPVCKKNVLLGGFRDDCRRKGGKDRYCRACRRNREQECRDDDLLHCPRCDQDKEKGEFYTNGGRREGLSTYCALCQANYSNEHKRKKRAGEYGWLLEEQGGACWICGKVPGRDDKSLCLDHDHATGEIRAYLCHNCNFVIGNCFEDPAILRQAIEYLEQKCGREVKKVGLDSVRKPKLQRAAQGDDGAVPQQLRLWSG